MTTAQALYSFPQVSAPLPAGTRGICSITHGNRTLRLRTNPNEFNWTYTLNKRIDATYGGRVIQLLGTKIDDFSIKADAGGGRWDYLNQVAKFMRDIMIDQRNGVPAVFQYTTRGWKLNVYVVSVPFADAVEEVLREFEIQFKVQEDVSGVMSKNSLSSELRRLQDGIGFQRSKYNDPRLQNQDQGVSDQEAGLGTLSSITNIVGQLGGYLGYVNNPFMPGGLAGEGLHLPAQSLVPNTVIPGVPNSGK
jgi:hypothetical protein